MSSAARALAAQPILQTATITSGGVLWRRAGRGRVEVCLARRSQEPGSPFAVPRGPIHEDERVADAAVRRIYEQTGLCGRSPRRLGRLTMSATGEIAYIHLMRAPRFAKRNLPSGWAWVPATTAPLLVDTRGERELLFRVAEFFDEGTRLSAVEAVSPRARAFDA